ncbi:MAG: hypothetical protein K0R84_634 [Clostridia bacterium]|jgi:tripartite-type tricarboxylate transporter receptor subunit TctC|nr:hypothetical protein [Clostridia bacterium]
MKLRKISYLAMVVVLVLSIFTGCASGAKQGDNASAAPAAGNDYPKQPVTIVVPYAAGGGADLMARALSTTLQKELGQPFIVSNKPGGSGAIGMAEVARSKEDGYTLILTSVGAATITPNNSDVGYTNKEFAPIAQVADIPLMLAVKADSPFKTVQEVFDYAEKNPGKLTYGTAGAGLIQNVSMEGLLMEMNKRGLFTHVPFNGGAEAVSALMGGQTDFAIAIATEIIPQMKSGQFRALAVSTAERYTETPDVPTFKESGYNYEVGVWYGFAAKAGTPDAVLQKLEGAFQKSLQDPEVIETFKKINQPIAFMDSKSFTEKWMSSFEKFKAVVAELNK